MTYVDNDGSVDRESVIHVLQATNGLSLITDGGNTEGDNAITMVKDGKPEVVILPKRVPRKMLHRFTRIYGVKIELFYNPALVVQGNNIRH